MMYTVYVLVAVLGIATGTTGCQPEHVDDHPMAAIHDRDWLQELDDPVVIRPLHGIELTAGQAATVVVAFDVASGYHMQANSVPFDYLVPTRLEVEAGEDITVGQPVYPAGKPYVMHNSRDTLAVYNGVVEIALPIYAAAAAQPEHYTLPTTIRYQLCDDQICFRPTSKSLTVSVDVRGSSPDASM